MSFYPPPIEKISRTTSTSPLNNESQTDDERFYLLRNASDLGEK